MITELNLETILMVKQKKMTVADFANKYGVPEGQEVKMAQLMIEQGQISVYENTTEEEDILAKAIKKNLAIEFADELEAQEEEYNTNIREEAKKNSDLCGVELTFKTVLEAQKAENYINSLGIMSTEITIKQGITILRVTEITPQEYTKIVNKYKTEKAINSVVNGVDKTAKVTTDTINTLATDIIAPTAKIAGKATMNIGKGLATTGAKVGAGLITSGANAVRETATALATDVEVIKAKREIRETTNSLMRFVRNKLDKRAKTGTGITRL